MTRPRWNWPAGRAVDLPPNPSPLDYWLNRYRNPRACYDRGSWIHWAGPLARFMPSHTGPCTRPAAFRCRIRDDAPWLYYCARHVMSARYGWTVEPL